MDTDLLDPAQQPHLGETGYCANFISAPLVYGNSTHNALASKELRIPHLNPQEKDKAPGSCTKNIPQDL